MKRIFGCLLLLACSSQLLQAQTRRVLLKDAANLVIDSFSSIQAAYDAIPVPLTQSYVITLRQTSGLWRGDRFPIRFSEKAGAAASRTITLRPENPAAMISLSIASRTDTSATIVFDGADWVIIDGEGPDYENPATFRFHARATNNGIRASFPVIRFLNGATHNTIRNVEGSNGRASTAGVPNESFIVFDTTSTGGGNSDNVIERTRFSGDCAVRSKGSAAHPNARNAVRNNLFEWTSRLGVLVEEGTASMEISDNDFWPQDGKTSAVTYIDATYLEDTLRVSGNTFHLIRSNYSDSAITGLRLRAGAPNSAGGIGLVSNNYFSNSGSDIYGRAAISGYPLPDSISRETTGIDIQAGAYPINALIAHNTLRLMPASGLGTARRLESALLRKHGANRGGMITVLNNIFHNERSGGGPGSGHFALDLSDTAAMTIDYNSYRSSDSLMRVGASSYMDFSAYRNSYPVLDPHSDDSAVLFETPDSYYLSALMKGRPEITGVIIQAVPGDKGGSRRMVPYRGADELAITCDTAAYRAAIFSMSGSAICAGSSIWLQYAENSYVAPALPSRGYIHQWQSRPLSAATFSDIPGAYTANLIVPHNAYTIYRVKDSCLADRSVRYTNQVAVGISGIALTIDSVSAARLSGYSYEFEAHHKGAAPTYYNWEFSDRTTATTTTANTVTATFAGPGTYTVTVRTFGDCSAAVSRTITVGDSSLYVRPRAGSRTRVYPNPTTGRLIVEGAAGAKASVYSIVGTQLLELPLQAEQHVLRLSALPAGSYLLRITYPDGSSELIRVAKTD